MALAGAASDRRQDSHRVAVGDRSRETADEADILVVQVHVDEPAQPRVVHEPLAQPVVTAVEVSEQFLERGTRALDRLCAAGIAAQDGRDTDLDRHFLSAPSLCVRVDAGSSNGPPGTIHSGSTAMSSSVTLPSRMRNDRNCGWSGSAVETRT